MDVEKELTRLRRTVRLQGLAIVLALIWTVGAWAFDKLLSTFDSVKVSRDGNAVSISSISDGPYIVTHLTVRGRDADSEGDKRTATLPEPSACIDSSGIDIDDITKLDWRNILGEPAPPPDATTPITALLVRAEYLEPKTSR